MRIQLRDSSRQPLGRLNVDPTARPTRVAVEPSGREIYLHWDSAVDDAGHLRRCVVCGCPAMFRTRSFPQVTLLVVVMAFAGAVIGALGYAADPLVLAALFVVLALDIATLIFAKRQLVCYRCRSTYTELSIARYHGTWDRREGERYPAVETAEPHRNMVPGPAAPDAPDGALSSPGGQGMPPTNNTQETA